MAERVIRGAMDSRGLTLIAGEIRQVRTGRVSRLYIDGEPFPYARSTDPGFEMTVTERHGMKYVTLTLVAERHGMKYVTLTIVAEQFVYEDRDEEED